jgi:NAD-dependent deacetylase
MQLADYIRQARRILIFTGAGISTGSGIPDFRGPQGIWTRRQPVYYQDFLSSEAARLEYWDQKLESWETFRTARPNAVHHAARMLESSDKLLMVVTQNVDGLHAQAGISAERLLEVHGTNAEVECQSCGRRAPADPVVRRFEAERVPPRCECGGLLKAATISFGQALDPRGTPYIVVNRGVTDHDGLPDVSLRLEGDVAQIFPAAVQSALGPVHR